MFDLVYISAGSNVVKVVDVVNKISYGFQFPFQVQSIACVNQFLILSSNSYQFYGMDLNVEKENIQLTTHKRSYSDMVLRVFAHQNRFLICGYNSIEQWHIVNMGDIRLIAPMDGGIIYHGLANKYSIVNIHGLIHWMDKEGVIRVLGGREDGGMSTLNAPVLAEYFKSYIYKYTRLFAHESNGHIYLDVQLSEENIFSYDTSTQIWTKIEPINIGILTTPLIEPNEDENIKFNRLKVETTEPNTVIHMQYSKNLGHTWSEWEETNNMKLSNATHVIGKIATKGGIRRIFLDVA